MSDVKWRIISYFAVGVVCLAVGILGTRACTKEPVTETRVEVRTETIPGPADTVFVTVRVPVRVPIAPPPDIADSLLQDYVVSLWVRLDEVTAERDSLLGIRATAITETPGATLRAHLDMQEFRRDPKRGLWAEALVIRSDTSRTTVVTASRGLWDYLGLGVYGGAGYNVVSRSVDVQVGAGVVLKLDKILF